MNIDNLKLCELTNKEFDLFAKNHPLNNFFQSIYMKKLLESENKKVFLLGLKDNNRLVCASLISETSRFLCYKTYEALKGYLIDYNNIKLVNKFTNEIIKFLKKYKGFRLIIDPYIYYIKRDINGDIKDFQDNNFKVVNNLKQIGFKELKHNAQVKWTFVLDLNKPYEKLYKEFKPNTRNAINKTINKYKLIIEELSYDKLNIFKSITSSTSKRKHFKDRSLNYYQNMYKIFKDDIKVLLCKIDLENYLNDLNNNLEKLYNNYKSSNNNIKKAKIKEEINSLNKNIKDIQNLYKKYGKYLNLASSMFILYGSEVVYLFSGSNIEFMKFNGQYCIQNEMIKYAVNNGYKRYNFYGINKDFKNDGVYEFKKGFNGYVEELLGAYEIKINYTYYLYNILLLIKKTIKNK